MFNAPVRLYNSAIPVSTRNAPTVFVTAKFNAPCSGPGSSDLYPHSAYAATLISSKNTNRLNKSPVKANPFIAATKISSSEWYSVPTVSKYRDEKISDAVASTLVSSTSIAPAVSIANPIPGAEPCRGVHPPNQ
jgi:hypothetical protein